MASFNSITDWENEQFSRVSPENPRAAVDAEARPNLQLNTAKLDGQPPAPGDRLRIHCEFVHVLHLGRLLTTEASYGSGPSDGSANVASKESSLSDKEWLPGRTRNMAVLVIRTQRHKLTVLQGGKPRYFQPERKIDGGVGGPQNP